MVDRPSLHRQRQAAWLALLAGLLLTWGCRAAAPPAGQMLLDPDLARELRDRAAHLYPASFRAVHRALLTAGGRQFLLDGYLTVQRPGSFRLVAKGDMGGTVFEIVKEPGQKARVVRNPMGLRPSWLTEGAARSLEALYLAQPGPEARLVRQPGGSLALVQDLPDGQQEQFLFQEDSRRWVRYALFSQDRCLFRADFAYGEAGPTGPARPRTVSIADYSWKYQLTLTVLELAATAAP